MNIIEKYSTPPKTSILYVYNGKIISVEKYESIKAEFPDNGAAIILATEWERKTGSGKYTYIYVHNIHSNKPIELVPNTDERQPIYEYE